jgi:hypothetical protein
LEVDICAELIIKGWSSHEAEGSNDQEDQSETEREGVGGGHSDIVSVALSVLVSQVTNGTSVAILSVNVGLTLGALEAVGRIVGASGFTGLDTLIRVEDVAGLALGAFLVDVVEVAVLNFGVGSTGARSIERVLLTVALKTSLDSVVRPLATLTVGLGASVAV